MALTKLASIQSKQNHGGECHLEDAQAAHDNGHIRQIVRGAAAGPFEVACDRHDDPLVDKSTASGHFPSKIEARHKRSKQRGDDAEKQGVQAVTKRAMPSTMAAHK